MKRRSLLVLIAIVCGMSAFSEQNGKLTVSITPGVAWNESEGPQIAVWVEDSDGTYVDTLFVSKRAAKKRERSLLPVWLYTVQKGEAAEKTSGVGQKTTVQSDAVSSATPVKEKVIFYSATVPTGRGYVVKIEVNNRADYNDTWQKNTKRGVSLYTGANGQPSVVYRASISAEPTGSDVAFQVLGTGAVDGKDGDVHQELSSLTSALQIISVASVKWANR